MKEEILHDAFVAAWNSILENRGEYLQKWKQKKNSEDPLEAFRANQFIKLIKTAKPMLELDKSIVSKVLERCVIYPMGEIEFFFLDGSVVEIDTIR